MPRSGFEQEDNMKEPSEYIRGLFEDVCTYALRDLTVVLPSWGWESARVSACTAEELRPGDVLLGATVPVASVEVLEGGTTTVRLGASDVLVMDCWDVVPLTSRGPEEVS